MIGERWRRVAGASPRVLGHRGASAHRLENTLEAFEAAMAAGADGVELDVQRCATGEVVVFHDETLQRLAGRPGRVDALPWSELRAVALAGAARIPTLREVFEALGPDALVNVEIKTPARALPARGLVPATVAAIVDADAVERVLVSSFHPGVLLAMRHRAPHIPRGLLWTPEAALPLRRGWSAAAVGALALHPHKRLVTGRSLRRWHRAGYAVNAWTVDGPVEIPRLVRLGVDALITNDPGATRALVERTRAGRNDERARP